MTAPAPGGWSGLVQVTASYATFGLVVEGGVVIDAAPISRRSIGRPIDVVAAYYRARGARVAAVDEPAKS